MATNGIVAPARNGSKPLNGTAPARVVPLPSLGEQIDRLHELRALIRQAQDEERRLTQQIVPIMESSGLGRLEGTDAVAILDTRTSLKVDVDLFLGATGRAGYDALSVSVTAARKHLGEQDLQAISETVTTPALRLQPIKPVAPAAA